MSKKIQILIIITIAILAIISVLLIMLLNVQEKDSSPMQNEYLKVDEIEKDSKLKEVSVRNDFYAVQTCIKKFYTYYESLFSSESDVYILDEEAKKDIENKQQENISLVYSMLDEEYINKNGITKENILTKISKTAESIIDITNMYVSEKSENISVYIVQGIRREIKTGSMSNFSIMVKTDSINKTFKVLLQDYINEKYTNIKIGQEIDIKVPENIKVEGSNIYEYKSISDEQYVLDLFSKYKEEIIYNKQLVYDNLDNEYKQKRFASFAEFETYAKNNTSNNVIASLQKYQRTENNYYTQYVCIDQKGNYYIFRETAVMKYTLILDTYTIELPEFKQKYEKSSDEDKILANTQKFFDALNDKNYKYAYSKLDETFRNNYFKTQADFEQYAIQNLFEENKFEVGNIEKQGEVYLYSVTISDKTGKNIKTIPTNFVMQLKEGNDFVMSFSAK